MSVVEMPEVRLKTLVRALEATDFLELAVRRLSLLVVYHVVAVQHEVDFVLVHEVQRVDVGNVLDDAVHPFARLQQLDALAPRHDGRHAGLSAPYPLSRSTDSSLQSATASVSTSFFPWSHDLANGVEVAAVGQVIDAVHDSDGGSLEAGFRGSTKLKI